MNFAHLKKVRVIISILLFVLITLTFFNFYSLLSEKTIEIISSFQIFPLIIKLFNKLDYKIWFFIGLFVLTFLFGRVYCSTICPLGTLQDIIIYVTRKLKKKKFLFKFSKKISSVRNSILFLSLVLFFSSNIVLINLLEPFSNYGRFVNVLAIPAYNQIINLVAFVLTKFNIYFISYTYSISINLLLIIFTISFLLFLIIVTALKGRWYCNYLCPSGALLSLISKFTFFKIKVDETTCTHCQKCERVCKANCIDSKSLTIDFSSCVVCYNCFDACPTSGIAFDKSFFKNKNKTKQIDNGRRDFVKNISANLLIASPLLLGFTAQKKDEYSIAKKTPITPPGSKSIENFSNKCSSCYLCISACPTKVIVPTLTDYGITGLFQPKMDYTSTYCNYDCNICSLVCPTDAISPISVEEKKLTQLGKAKLVKEDCIVETKKTDCGACSEHCPTKAVTMVPYGNNLRIPELNNDICIGCGACEKPCPTKPRKAIFVVANRVHQKAKKPVKQKQEKGFDSKSDFPF